MKTFREKYEDEMDWKKRVLLIDMFHCLMQEKHEKWTIENTAVSMGISTSLASENLKIASAIHDGGQFKSRADALRRIRSDK